MRVLLLEDDVLIGDGIVVGLGQMGMDVAWVQNGIDGFAALGTLDAAPYDVAILDLSLPGMDGLAVLAGWRRQGWDTPVLILTARDAVADRVAGLDQGGDDYLVKPFALAELAARLRALQRRRQAPVAERLEHAGLVFDPRARQAWRDDEALVLTARELALLELLLRSKGRPLSRRQIEDSLYGWEQDLDSNAVEVHIHHLRKKLGNGFIRTVRGIGYSLGGES